MSDRVKRPRKPQPMQPIVIATDHVVRFQANAIVRWLLDEASAKGIDLNMIARQPFSDEDRRQFAQLIGYSVSGYGGLSYASGSRKHMAAVDKAARPIEREWDRRFPAKARRAGSGQ